LPRDTKYATLSHCWGPNPNPQWQLKKANMVPYQEAIPLEALLKTFRDAKYIAYSLGIDWIDSLCIIQEGGEDFQREAPLMADVYGNSYLNIAAAGAVDGNGVCFYNEPFERLKRVTTVRRTRKPVWDLWPEDLYEHGFERTHLASRGWCLQESISAPRTLHFTGAQLFWECKDNVACESFPDWTSTLEFPYPTIRKDSLRRSWGKILERYSQCRLTFGKDKLIALAGIIHRAEEQRDDTCLAVLWRSVFEQPYRAPSWSWASIDARINTLQ
jgi:hypothetical protein